MAILNDKFNNYSVNALKNAVFRAQSDKEMLKPKHIFISLLNQKGSIAAHLLKDIKMESDNAGIDNSIDQKIMEKFNISEQAKKIIEKAVLLAALHKHKYIGTEHLLAGILEIGDPSITHIFIENNIDTNTIKDKLSSIFENTSNFPAFYNQEEEILDDQPAGANIPLLKKKSYLENFCVNLTDESFQKDINHVIGRGKEIKRLIQILCRRNKNNPVLIGEAGVGKTAIVEGLAKKISLGEVPGVLFNKKILALDINSLVAGTIFRGEFEARLKGLISEISNDKSIILFIDEIHNIIGAGSASGTMDVANILKPILAKGKIKIIGATTFNEYKKHIEKDPALERRFQPIIVKEPTIEEAIEILQGIKGNYEEFHNIEISHDAILSATKLSSRFIQDRFLPDKAIDLLDEAASRYKLLPLKNTTSQRIKELEKKFKRLNDEKEKNVIEENFDLAIRLKDEENKVLIEMEKLKNVIQGDKKIVKITKKEIQETLADMINIPRKEISFDASRFDIKNLEKNLKDKIIDQDEALMKIIRAVRRSSINISPERPLASFLFLGPSGVGKTELAKALAESLFHDKKSLIRVDMTEYSESFNISKLIGAPAGYVGYEQGGILTEKIRKNPCSVILFDEVEKAHKSLFNLLLPVLEEGTLTDASGRVINFKNSIIIMTSNLGLSEFNQQAQIGFALTTKKKQLTFGERYAKLKEQILDQVEETLPREFLNRIDDIIVFNPLTLHDIKKIVILNLDNLSKRLFKEQGIKINYDKKLIDHLTKKSTSKEHGARLIRKVIQESIEDFIAEKLINKEITEHEPLNLTFTDNNIRIK